jgi:hypothetical protein
MHYQFIEANFLGDVSGSVPTFFLQIIEKLNPD